MESITKNKKSNEEIRKMVKRAYPNVDLVDKIGIKEMSGGFCNAVYEISLKNQTVILKIGPAPDTQMMSYEVELIKTEVDALQLMRRSTCIPVPEVIYYDDSHEICESDYFIMSKIDGECYEQKKKELSVEENNLIMKTLGEYNRKLNDIKGDCFGIYSDRNSFHTNSEFVFYLFENLLKDGEKKESDLKDITAQQLMDRIHTTKEALDEVKEPSFVHWDLWEGNVFIKNKKVEGIIDFERALWGDHLMEFAFSFVDEPHPSYLQGYGRKMNDRRGEQVRRLVYTLYRELSMIIECDFRDYEDDGMYQWITGEFKKTLDDFDRIQ